MTTVVMTSSEDNCRALAKEYGLTDDECVYAYDIASFLRCTGYEDGVIGDESVYEINIADWVLMEWYNSALLQNNFNGFGLREIYPERADQSILDLVKAINSGERQTTL